jgi:hypothetical protein
MKIELVTEKNYLDNEYFISEFWDFINEEYSDIDSEDHEDFDDAIEEFMTEHFELEKFMDETNLYIIDCAAPEQLNSRNDPNFYQFVMSRVNWNNNKVNIDKLAFKYSLQKSIIDQMNDDFKKFLINNCGLEPHMKKSLKKWINRYHDAEWLKWILIKTNEELEAIEDSEYANYLFSYDTSRDNAIKRSARQQLNSFIQSIGMSNVVSQITIRN